MALDFSRVVNFNLGIVNVHSSAHGLDLANLGRIRGIDSL